MNYVNKVLDDLVLLNTKLEDYKTKSKQKTEEEKEEFLAIIITDFDSFQRSAHENLNYSLLTGEYISNQDLQESINELKNKLLKLLNDVTLIPELQKITYQIVEGLKKIIQSYIHFQSDIVNRYSINKKDYVFTLNSSYIEDKLEKETKEYIKFFNFNILISNYDLQLSQDENRLINLYKIENSLIKINLSGFETLRDLIINKCNFLKAKWLFRKQEEAPDEADTSFMIDGQEDYVKKNNHEIYNDWSTYSSVHYELEKNWKSVIEEDSKRLHNKELKDLSSLDIHRLIKYNKDVEKDIERLEEISKYLCEQSQKINDSQSNFFDVYAYSVMSNYALNNKFSLFVEQNKDIAEIKKEYLKTKKSSNRYLNNFFLEYKYLNAAISILKKNLTNQESKKFLKDYEEFIKDDLKSIFEKYEYNHNWSLKRHNYIFQLPFEECKVDIHDNDMASFLFIASSFVLPPSLKKLESQFSFIKTKYHELLHHIESIEILKTDLDKIDKLNEEIKSQKDTIDKNQIRFIEVLGIFTALMAYIFGSISTFRFLETPQEFLLFNVALALSLIAFVSILIIFIRGRGALRRNWGWLAGLLILFILFWVGIIYFDFVPTNQNNDKDASTKKTDSISLIIKDPVNLNINNGSTPTVNNQDSLSPNNTASLKVGNNYKDSAKAK